jgi:HEPN domain-containing protein
VVSMSFELLKRRALSFLRNARSSFEQGEYDISLFNIEQFIQLYSKYLLYKRMGDFPKTNSIIRLLKDIVKVYDAKELENFIQDHLEGLYLLEEAYISSRYLPREYDMSIAAKLLNLSEKVLEVFKCLESR